MKRFKSSMTASTFKTIMRTLDLNQTEMAEVLGVSPFTVSRYVNGTPIPLPVYKHMLLLAGLANLIPKKL